MKNKLMVRRSIYELSKKMSIDLVIYTKAEYKILSSNKNSFFYEIETINTEKSLNFKSLIGYY